MVQIAMRRSAYSIPVTRNTEIIDVKRARRFQRRLF